MHSMLGVFRHIFGIGDCVSMASFLVSGSISGSHCANLLMSHRCWSAVGRSGDKQTMSLHTGCLFNGNIQHEFLHVLGFHHEHTRPDRDLWIYVDLTNVNDSMCRSMQFIFFFIILWCQ